MSAKSDKAYDKTYRGMKRAGMSEKQALAFAKNAEKMAKKHEGKKTSKRKRK